MRNLKKSNQSKAVRGAVIGGLALIVAGVLCLTLAAMLAGDIPYTIAKYLIVVETVGLVALILIAVWPAGYPRPKDRRR